MVIIYSTLFRKAEVLRTVERAIENPDAFVDDQVRLAFQEAWGARDEFCKQRISLCYPV